MFTHAIKLFKLYFIGLLAISAMLLALDIWFAETSSTGATIIFGLIIHIFHYTLLTGEKINFWRKGTREQNPSFKYFLVYLFPLFISYLVFQSINVFVDDQRQIMAIAILIFTPVIILTLSLIGTMLPSAVLKRTASPIVALRRAQNTFWFVLWRLLLGPTLLITVFIAATLWANKQGILPETPSNFSEITPWTIVLLVPLLIVFFSGALTASILSMAYAKSQNETLPNLPR